MSTALGAIAFGGLGPGMYGLVAAMVFLGTIAGIGLLAPDDGVLLAAGTAASSGHVKLVPVLAIGWAAGILGDSVGFGLGRRWGASRYAARRHRMKIANNRWGALALVAGRFLGPVRAFGPVVAGASPVPRRRFLAMSIAGAGLWSASFTLAGYGLARSIGSSLDVAGYAVLALTALAVLVWALRRRAGSFPRAATERG